MDEVIVKPVKPPLLGKFLFLREFIDEVMFNNVKNLNESWKHKRQL